MSKQAELVDLGPTPIAGALGMALLGRPAFKWPPIAHMLGLVGAAYEWLEFEAGGEQEIEFVVPRLEGMDELHVVGASVGIYAKRVELDPVVVAAPDGSACNFGLPSNPQAPEAAAGELEKVIIRGLRPKQPPATGWALGASPHSIGDRSILWDDEGSAASSSHHNAAHLHLLVRLRDGGQAGPPVAAFPSFAPVGPLYDSALAGGQLSLTRHQDGKVDAVLRFDPPLATGAVQLLLTLVDEVGTDPGVGLPHEAVPVVWVADELEARWATGPRGLAIEAFTDPEAVPAPVAAYPGPSLPAETSKWIDYSAAARSLLRQAYAEQSGPPTLTLRFASSSRAKIGYRDFSVAAEYRYSAVDSEGERVALRGAPTTLRLDIPPGLRPARATVTFDGSFGRAELIPASDAGQLVPSQAVDGYRISGTTRVARWIELPGPPDSFPPRPLLTRVSVEGRSAGDCELLLAVHRGRPGVIGERVGDPVALSVVAGPRASWQRAELGALARAASRTPGSTGIWVVAEVSKGTFWWSAQHDDDDVTHCLRSAGGASWDARPGRPRVQVHHELVDDQGLPIPRAIPCWLNLRPAAEPGQAPDWDLRRADIGANAEGELPSFRAAATTLFGAIGGVQIGVPGEGPVPDTLDRLAELGGVLELAFDCRRDVDFRVLDVAFTYSPWLAAP